MQTTLNKKVSLPIDQKIAEEEINYEQALKIDAPFEVLKEIKNRIRILKSISNLPADVVRQEASEQ